MTLFKTWSPHSKVSDVLAAIWRSLQKGLMPYLSLEKLTGVWALTRLRDPGMRYRQDRDLAAIAGLFIDSRLLEVARPEFCRFEDAMCDSFAGLNAVSDPCSLVEHAEE